tara:strand:- start:329 stop:1342 length:1014 start_codon:yes stop_codon:yes gene_type:complete
MTIKLELSKTAQKTFDELKLKYLDKLENARYKYLVKYNNRRKLNWRFNLPMLLLFISADTYINGIHLTTGLYAMIPLLFLAFAKVPFRIYRRKYKKHFLGKFIPEFFKNIFNYTYTNKPDMLEKRVEGYKLLGDFHTYKGEDHLAGVNKDGINLDYEEAEVYGDLNNFKGGIVVLEMPKQFRKRVVVKSNAVFRDSSEIKIGMNKANINDKTFNKYFSVYSEDASYAEKLITPKLMKKIIDASKKLHDLFNEEFMLIAPHFHHQIESYNNTTDHKMATATLELEFVGNKVLLLLRGQYDFLAPANLEHSVYCSQRLSVIEQEFKTIESIARLIEKGE